MCLDEAFLGMTLHLIFLCPVLPSLPSTGINCRNTSYWIPYKFIFLESTLRLTDLQHWASQGNWWEMSNSLYAVSSRSVLPASVLWTVSSKPLLPTGFSRQNNRRSKGGKENNESICPQVLSWFCHRLSHEPYSSGCLPHNFLIMGPVTITNDIHVVKQWIYFVPSFIWLLGSNPPISPLLCLSSMAPYLPSISATTLVTS